MAPQIKECKAIGLSSAAEKAKIKECIIAGCSLNIQEAQTRKCIINGCPLNVDGTLAKECLKSHRPLNLEETTIKECIIAACPLNIQEAQTRECIINGCPLNVDGTLAKECLNSHQPLNAEEMPAKEDVATNLPLNDEGYTSCSTESNTSDSCSLCLYPNLGYLLRKPIKSSLQSQHISGSLILEYITSGRKLRRTKPDTKEQITVPECVPDEFKDSKYLARRKRNNESVKKSREIKRVKEQQITDRVIELENENSQLKTGITILQNELESLRDMN